MSKQFIALSTGTGEGCDFCIGCNLRMDHLNNANNMDEALQKAEELFDDWGAEERIANMLIIEVADDALLDINGIIKRRKETQQQKHDAETEARERKQLAELKDKYEDG